MKKRKYATAAEAAIEWRRRGHDATFIAQLALLKMTERNWDPADFRLTAEEEYALYRQVYLDSMIDADDSFADGMTLADLKASVPDDWRAREFNNSPEARSTGIAIATQNSALFRIIGDLPDGLPNLYLTFACGPQNDVATFASDNAGQLRAWWIIECAKLLNPARPDYSVGFIKRQFMTLRDTSTGLPIKRVSGAIFRPGGAIQRLTAAQTRLSCTIDPRGKPMPPEPGVVYVDFE